MAFVRVKVGDDEIVIGTFAPQSAMSLLKSNFVLSQVAERLQDLSETEFQNWMRGQPGGEIVLQRIAAGWTPGSEDFSVDPRHAADEVKILSWIMRERWAQMGGRGHRVSQPETSPPAPGEPANRPRASTMREKVKAFMRAIAGPKVSREVFERRLAICASGECGFLKRKGEKLYCGACGCPSWSLAELHKKLWFAELECPLERPLWIRAD